MSVLSFWGVDTSKGRPYNPPIADAERLAAPLFQRKSGKGRGAAGQPEELSCSQNSEADASTDA
jgi:hypothetical protein